MSEGKVYEFRPGPTYRAADPQEQWAAAMHMEQARQEQVTIFVSAALLVAVLGAALLIVWLARKKNAVRK